MLPLLFFPHAVSVTLGWFISKSLVIQLVPRNSLAPDALVWKATVRTELLLLIHEGTNGYKGSTYITVGCQGIILIFTFTLFTIDGYLYYNGQFICSSVILYFIHFYSVIFHSVPELGGKGGGCPPNKKILLPLVKVLSLVSKLYPTIFSE